MTAVRVSQDHAAKYQQNVSWCYKKHDPNDGTIQDSVHRTNSKLFAQGYGLETDCSNPKTEEV
ncbi:hypothetical protein Ciccas_014542 [Cichlidogyrus casuarinus]|uniref:Uncharacterized protein n=1 Tax=Cichlidogyrus casuarinus TaxID=1844966 RepID=A0ABD2PI62_9PLAT